MGDFTTKMTALTAQHLAASHRLPSEQRAELAGEIIEQLTSSLALVVADACGGDGKCIDNMLSGVTSHLYERATDHAPLAAFMSRTTPGALR